LFSIYRFVAKLRFIYIRGRGLSAFGVKNPLDTVVLVVYDLIYLALMPIYGYYTNLIIYVRRI